MRRRAGIATVVLALAGLLAGAAPAHAAFSLAGVSAAPADTAAGANADFRIHLEPRDGKIRDLDLHLPPGLVGDPNATDRCPIARFEADACPAATQVGRSSTTVQIAFLSQTAQGVIYNIAPRGREPARLGVKITPPIGGTVRLESPVTARPDGGLDSTLRGLPDRVAGLEVTITALEIVLSGRASGRPFMTNPTSCVPAETVIDARSYAGEAARAKAAFTPTRCEALPFAPGFEAVLGAPGLIRRGDKPPLRTIVTQDRGQANTRSVEVTLPKDLSVSFDQLERACAPEVLAAGQCPPTATIGTATAQTPLLSEPLAGPVLFAFGEATLPDLVLNLTGPLALTLRGANTLTNAGQVTKFDGIPDVPLSRFELAFKGGRREGLLTLGRDVCVGRRPRFRATFTSQAGATHTVTVPARLEGCAPQITVRLGSLKRRQPSLRVRVDAGAERLRRVRLTLPRGLVARGAARGVVTGSGARGSRLRRRGRIVEVTVPGAGARSVAIRFRAGTLRARRGFRGSTRFRVAVTDAAGKTLAKSLRPER
jgi:hypothetical protein